MPTVTTPSRSASSRAKTVFVCGDCGSPHPKWAGQCSSCGEWNTLIEEIDRPPASAPPSSRPGPALISDVEQHAVTATPTHIAELDRVLGGGLVPGSVTLLGGEPGIGKSTLLLQLLAANDTPTLYVSAEESAATRRDLTSPHRRGDHRDPSDARRHRLDPDRRRPGVLVPPWQRRTGPRLRQPARRAGERAGYRHGAGRPRHQGGWPGRPAHLGALRLLRASKHRFGPTNELGLFEMGDAGLRGVPDPSTMFLADRRTGIAGSAVVPTMEGQRPIVVEVQALATPGVPGVPSRRSAQGLDGGRLSMLAAVLGRRSVSEVGEHDIYASTAGGAKLCEPGLDLGVCLAIISAVVDRPLPADLAAFGEVGLGGELRQVGQAARRVTEAHRLGFRRVIVPGKSPEVDDDITMLRAGTLLEAAAAAGLHRRGGP
jgi:DNA repair protein RadA/Sms